MPDSGILSEGLQLPFCLRLESVTVNVWRGKATTLRHPCCKSVHGVIATKHEVVTEPRTPNGLVSDTVQFGQGFE
jgi:hypothetical protein